MWIGWAAAAAAVVVLAAGATAAQTPTPTAAITARLAQYREIGTAFKAINDELKKDAPAKFVMASSARQIATNLQAVRTMFPAGSDAASGKTRALPAIWTTRATFDRLQAGAVVEADKLALAMRGADLAAIQAQSKALGATCQGCHRQFRAED